MFFFNDPATTEIYTLSLHDALPIYQTRVYAGWDSSTNLPTGPTQVIRQDRGYGYTETLTMSATPTYPNLERPQPESSSQIGQRKVGRFASFRFVEPQKNENARRPPP